MFDEFFSGMPAPFGMFGINQGFSMDVKEMDEGYILTADLPGLRKEDIDLSYENNYFTICAKREESNEISKDRYVRRERSFGEFRR